MKCQHVWKPSVAMSVVLGLILAATGADVSARPRGGPGPSPNPRSHPTPHARPHPAPHHARPHPAPHAKRPPKHHPKPGPKVHPKGHPRIAPKAVHPVVVPRYKPRRVVVAGAVVTAAAGGTPVLQQVTPSAGVVEVVQPAVVPAKQFDQATAYRVISVGENYAVTLWIDGKPVRVRMLGVEAPLVATSEHPSGVLAPAARAFAANLLVGESVYVDYDPDLAETDEDGTPVAYLHRAPDGLLVNLELIRQGYALAAQRYAFHYAGAFAAYQKRAEALGKGVWAKDQG